VHVLSKIAYARVGRCLVYVSADAPVPADEFATYLEFLRPIWHEIDRALVLEGGPGPSASQRRALLELIGQKDTPTAVVIGSAIARGALKALSWFNESFQPFRPDEMTAAIEWLALDARAASEVRSTAEELRARLARREPESRESST
jgi:hypothetical protein